MLGEFFGVTGAISALLEMDSPTVIRLSSVLNNPLDVFRLRKFKDELLYLCDFLDNKVELDYGDPKIRKLNRQIKLIRSNDIDALNRSYKCDISGFTEQQKNDLIESIEAEIKSIARSTGASMSVVNSFKKVNSGEVVSLGDYELKVLLHFKKYYRNVLGNYIKLIKLSSFKELTVFNERLHRVAAFGPWFLLNVVERLLTKSGTNREYIKNLCLDSVAVIRAHYPSAARVSQERSKSEISHFLESINIRKYLSSMLGLDFNRLGTSELPESVRVMGEIFDEQSKPLFEIFENLMGKGLLSLKTAEELLELYYKLFRLDYDYEYICSQIFPETENITLSREEIEGIYSRLGGIGFFFLSLSNSKLFIEGMKKISFSTESKTIISPDEELSGLTYRKVVDDVENLCLAMMPAGSPIEEVRA